MTARMLGIAGLLLSAWGAAAVAQSAPAPLELVVGVRADAAPFSFARTAGPQLGPGTGPLFVQGYDGYVVHICDTALEELGREFPGLDVRAVTVTAKTRFASLKNTAPPSDRIDILCDPATLTESRVTNRYASVPIYLSGISFAYQDPFPPGEACASLLGAVAETTTQHPGMKLILESGKWPRYRARIAEALQAPQPDPDAPVAAPAPAKVSEACDAPPIDWAPDHDTLAQAFCDGKVLYYVGDIEIIRSKLAFLKDKRLAEEAMRPCSYGIDDATYTDERYAIFARIPDETEAEKARVMLRLFGILAEKIYTDKAKAKSILIESYQRAFPTYRPSRLLQAFFWSLTGDIGTK
jgi:hypothetical protein